MRVGIGGRLFGVRAGVNVGRGGVGYGIGAGPASATGLIALCAILFAVVLGAGVLVAVLPLAVVSIPLLIPYRAKTVRIYVVIGSLVLFSVLSKIFHSLLQNFLQNRYRGAKDLDELDSMQLAGSILNAGWYIGITLATLAMLNASLRGKKFYDSVFTRTENKSVT
jgi:hypothetical protein